MFGKNNRNLTVRIEASLIIRSVLRSDQQAKSGLRYRPLERKKLYISEGDMMYRDLKPKFNFWMVTDKLTVEPQIGDRISYLGKVKWRQIHFDDPQMTPEQNKRIKKWDLRIGLEPEIYEIYGETLNDIPLKQVYEIWKDYTKFHRYGFNANSKIADQEFWQDWLVEFEKLDEID